PPDPAVAGVEEHPLVLPHRGDQPAMPPLALAREDAARFRDLRPGDGVGNEGDLVADLLPLQVTMQADDEVHVLHHAPRLVPADGVEVLLAEQAERAGDDETAAQAVPAEPAEQERAQVIDHLDAWEDATGDPG